MESLTLKLQSLTRTAFAPFGDVIETEHARHFGMNDDRLERYHDLAMVDIDGGPGSRPVISIAQCNHITELPVLLECVERHPLGSQAFIPMTDIPLVTVVAPPGDTVPATELCAFISNGQQGVNYHRGVWHMPMIALDKKQRFVIIDRGGPGDNCDVFYFKDQRILLSE